MSCSSIQIHKGKAELWFNRDDSGGMEIVFSDGDVSATFWLPASAVQELIGSFRAMEKESE